MDRPVLRRSHAPSGERCQEAGGVVLTDLLILSVLQLGRVVEHAEHGDDEVEQGEDAVEPQKSVPARGKPQMSEVVSAVCLF